MKARSRTDLIVVHHSATPPDRDIGAAEIRRWHMAPPNSWADIGYHFCVRLDGTVEPARPVDLQGAHVRGHNVASVSVCLIGTGPDFTPAQRRSLLRLLLALTEVYRGARVVGHRDLAATECPGFDVATLGALLGNAAG